MRGGERDGGDKDGGSGDRPTPSVVLDDRRRRGAGDRFEAVQRRRDPRARISARRPAEEDPAERNQYWLAAARGPRLVCAGRNVAAAFPPRYRPLLLFARRTRPDRDQRARESPAGGQRGVDRVRGCAQGLCRCRRWADVPGVLFPRGARDRLPGTSLRVAPESGRSLTSAPITPAPTAAAQWRIRPRPSPG